MRRLVLLFVLLIFNGSHATYQCSRDVTMLYQGYAALSSLAEHCKMKEANNENVLSEMATTVNELSTRISDLKLNHNNLQTTYETMHAQISPQIDALEKHFHNLEIEESRLNPIIEKCNSKLDSVQQYISTCDSFHKDLKESYEQFNDLKAELSNMKLKINDLSTNRSARSEKFDSLVTEIKGVQDKVGLLENRLQYITQSISALKTKLPSDAIKLLNQIIENLNNEIYEVKRDYNNSMEAERAEAVKANLYLEQNFKTVSRLSDEMIKMKRDLAKLLADQNEQSVHQYEVLEKSVKTCVQDVESLRTQKALVENEASVADKKFAVIFETLKSLNNTVKSMGIKCSDVKRNGILLQEEIEKMNATMIQDVHHARNDVSKLEQFYDEMSKKKPMMTLEQLMYIYSEIKNLREKEGRCLPQPLGHAV